MKVRINDQIQVIAGKDKGKKGKIIKILRKQDKIVVEKVNIRTKHIKKTAERAGQKIQFEAPINVSNVMFICPSCNKASRLGYQVPKNGKKERICKKCKVTVTKTVKSKK